MLYQLKKNFYVEGPYIAKNVVFQLASIVNLRNSQEDLII